MSYDVEWEEGETLTVKKSENTEYRFQMDRGDQNQPRVRIFRYNTITRANEHVKSLRVASDDNATNMLLKAIQTYCEVDCGLEDE